MDIANSLPTGCLPRRDWKRWPAGAEKTVREPCSAVGFVQSELMPSQTQSANVRLMASDMFWLLALFGWWWEATTLRDGHINGSSTVCRSMFADGGSLVLT